MKHKIHFIKLAYLPLLLLGGCLIMGCENDSRQAPPNIILILVDDMGYSDIGCYGGEIPTPNIDRLAAGGLRFTQFYNTSRCCPTRASLLTGLFQHQTGIGTMAAAPANPDAFKDWGTPGYIGHLNENCVTMAEALQQSGYHTYMTGKWHVGFHQPEHRPLQRGFEKYYGILAGASSYFKPEGLRGLTYMNDSLPAPDTAYYTTDAFTDYALKFIKEQKDEQPYFLYLAYNAPHWPLQAKEEDIEKFVGKYRQGWDSLRMERYRKQQKLGLFDQDWKPFRDTTVRAWDDLTEQQKTESDYRMAVYAAQVYSVDYNVGKILEYLEKTATLDNTLIVFLSDNGACAEYSELGSGKLEDINNPSLWGAVSYGRAWANMSNTPFQSYKVFPGEGGINTPLIAHWPGKIKSQAGQITDNRAYLIDLMPTFLEIAGATYPNTFHNGQSIFPLEGNSLLPVFTEGEKTEHEYMYWEHVNRNAISKGPWKALKHRNKDNWELYNLENDRLETTDLAAQYPELMEELTRKWEEWAYSHQVLPKKIE